MRIFANQPSPIVLHKKANYQTESLVQLEIAFICCALPLIVRLAFSWFEIVLNQHWRFCIKLFPICDVAIHSVSTVKRPHSAEVVC